MFVFAGLSILVGGGGGGGGGEQIFVLFYFKLLSRPSMKKYFVIGFKHFHYYFIRNVSVLICHFPVKPHPPTLMPYHSIVFFSGFQIKC